jgi:cysteinyl-tRNA synthetase
MSKSLGNYLELPDLLKKYHPLVIRYFLIRQHYRSVLDYKEEKLTEAANGLKKIWQLLERLGLIDSAGPASQNLTSKAKQAIEKHLDNDINTPRALAVVFDLIKKANHLIDQNKLSQQQAQAISQLLTDFDKVFGILKPSKKITIPKAIQQLIKQREQARRKHDWPKADQIRKQIEAKGYQIEDTEKGPKIKARP